MAAHESADVAADTLRELGVARSAVVRFDAATGRRIAAQDHRPW